MVLLHLIYPGSVNRDSLHKIIERQFARKPIIDFDPAYNEINEIIAGLTLYDFSSRWGEEEIKAWLRGEKVEIRYEPEIKVQPINLGKVVIHTEKDLIEYIESNKDWYENIIEDKEGYSLLLRWVSDSQGLDKKKIFDKMVRTYQQDGREYVEQSILRYFDPQRPIQIDMKTYDLWSSEDISELVESFIKHLDDIWKITPIEKIKFYLFPFEFSLRQIQTVAEDKSKLLVKSILDKISSSLSLTPKSDFNDYICTFYNKLSNDKLINCFYSFNKKRTFKDCENNSYKTIQSIAAYFHQNSELFSDKYLVLEKNEFIKRTHLSDLNNLPLDEFVFAVLKENTEIEIDIDTIEIKEDRLFEINYSFSKSLTEYFKTLGISKPLKKTYSKNNIFKFKKKIYYGFNKLYSQFLKHIEQKGQIITNNLPESIEKRLRHSFIKEAKRKYGMNKIIACASISLLIGIALSYAITKTINANYNPSPNLPTCSLLIVALTIGSAFLFLGSYLILKKKLAIKISTIYLSLAIALSVLGVMYLINILVHSNNTFNFRSDNYLNKYFSNSDTIISVKPYKFIRADELLHVSKGSGGYTHIDAKLQVWTQRRYNALGSPIGHEKNYPSALLGKCLGVQANYFKKETKYRPFSASFEIIKFPYDNNYSVFGFIAHGYLILFSDDKVAIYNNLSSLQDFVMIAKNPLKDNKSYRPDLILRAIKKNYPIKGDLLKELVLPDKTLNKTSKIDLLFMKKQISVKINDKLLMEAKAGINYIENYKMGLAIGTMLKLKIGTLQIANISNNEKLLRNTRVPLIQNDMKQIEKVEVRTILPEDITLYAYQNKLLNDLSQKAHNLFPEFLRLGGYFEPKSVIKGNIVEVLYEKGDLKCIRYGVHIGFATIRGTLATNSFENDRGNYQDRTKVELQSTFGTTNVSAANIRSGPSTKHSVVGVARKGDIFELVSKTNGWYKIKYKGQEGFIGGKLVQIKNSF